MKQYVCYKDVKFENRITVGDLIEQLKQFDQDLPVNVHFMGCTDRIIGLSVKGTDTRYTTQNAKFLEIR